ncbi:MAG: transglutaminase family protein [Xanthobacteraceae bacterium]
MRHTTVYRYSRPVALGDHRLMLRPRDSHDLRLIKTNLSFSTPASVRWIHDVFGNSVAIASFCEPAAELRIESSLVLETFSADRPPFQITPDALRYPFIYSADDRIDLGRMQERQYPDPNDRLGSWARGFVRSNPTDTSALLGDLNNGIKAQISYQSRETEGTQTPVETLNRGWGSCRDLAVLLIEAARSLGFGARVVTGYLYRASADVGSPSGIGAGTTHAWADIYVPGSGWISYDPTNGTIGGQDLIRIAVTRDIDQAIPISGSFVGTPGSYLGMTVDVAVVSDSAVPRERRFA